MQAQTDDEALITAAYEGDLDVVKDLLAAGVPVNGKSGMEALGRAALGGHLDVVTALLGAGVRTDGHALVWATQAGHVDVVKALLSTGLPTAKHRRYAQEVATINGHAEIRELLCRN